MQSSRAANYHVSCLLEYPFYLKSVLNEPVCLFKPKSLVIVQIQLKLYVDNQLLSFRVILSLYTC